MMVNFFDQFLSPKALGIPLMLLALILPSMLISLSSQRLVNNRLTATQLLLFTTLTKQLMTPISPAGQKWALTLLSTFLFLLTLNTMGLLPYTFTPTTQLSMNLGLAIPLWLMTVLIGLRNQTTSSLAHLLPEGTPGPLIPALVVIETISLFIRPLALGVRLTANLTAGHLLIQLISCTVLALTPLMPKTALAALMTLLLLTGLEIAVAIIQAYVFTLLLSLYLQENT